MVKIGLFMLAAGVLFATTSLSRADSPDPANPFTKHGLPVPGVYFTNKETAQPAAIASSSPKSVGNPKQTAAKATKKQSKHSGYANN
jgi:hypothetical protein